MRMEVSRSRWWLSVSAVLLMVIGSSASAATSRSAVSLFDCAIEFENRYTEVLTADCTSNGGNRKTLTIPPHAQDYYLAHVLVKERTYASCSITLGNRKATFDVFDWDRDKKHCPENVCYWVVNEIGLWMIFQDKTVLNFPWP